jgi:hypothetical protein
MLQLDYSVTFRQHRRRKALDSRIDCRGRRGAAIAEWLSSFIDKIAYDATHNDRHFTRLS